MAPDECPNCHQPIEDADARICPNCRYELGISRRRPGEDTPEPPGSDTVPTEESSDDTPLWLNEVFTVRASPTEPVGPPQGTEIQAPRPSAPPRRGRSKRWIAICAAAAIVVVGAAVAGGLLATRNHDRNDAAGLSSTVSGTTSAVSSGASESTSSSSPASTTETTTTTETPRTTTAPTVPQITAVDWDPDMHVIRISVDSWPDVWPWTMFVDGEEVPLEGGEGKAVVRPNAVLDQSPTGLYVGSLPWVSGLESTDFPPFGTIQFDIPGRGLTNVYEYDFTGLLQTRSTK